MLSSTLGKKLLMSLTGLFLISFLTIHLIGNLAIFSNDNGLAFNAYAVFMTTNPLIGTVSYLLYAGIILHVAIAIMLYFSNSSARPVKYKVQNAKENSSWSSRSMTLLGMLILAFILLHLKDFWWQYKHEGGYQFVEDVNGNRAPLLTLDRPPFEKEPKNYIGQKKIEQIRQLAKSELSNPEIAEQVGVSLMTVHRYLKS